MSDIKHRENSALQQEHSPLRFLFLSLSIWVFFFLLFILCVKILFSAHLSALLSIPAFFLAALVTDFFSGIVHWGLDTWGTLETPVLGMTLIRDFRMHHVDEKDIALHGLVPTVGPSALFAMVFEIIALLIHVVSPVSAFFCAFFAAVAFWAMMTNQIHKWAHTDIGKIPPVPRFFQKIGIFLAPQPHHVHHIEPFTQSYCITTGWCNSFMTRTQFFRKLEKIIFRLTGAIPRADDIGIEAARELAKAEHILDNKKY